MRLVLDTNVIIAAFATRGLCAEVFEVCLEGHHIVLSEAIMEETREKLLRKIKLPDETVREIVDYLTDTAEIITPEIVDSSVCRDPADLFVIGTALSGKAEAIITGDKDLLSLKRHRGIEIMSPRDFWQRLRGQ